MLVLALALSIVGGLSISNVKAADAVKPAPNFKVTAIDGTTVELSQLKGKKVYLVFFASWCGPCMTEMPEVNALYKESKSNKDLVIIPVSVTDSKDELVKLAKEKGWELPLYENNGTIDADYAVESIPTSVFIDTKGNIAKTHVGAMDKAAIKAEIANLK
jgi:thiol-disulfide isomerase/thioredoxin